MSFGGLSGDDMHNVKATLEAENLGNNEKVEMAWVMKATNHAEIYFNLITSVDPSLLKLSKVDDEVYSKFRDAFPDMNIEVIDEDEMKSAKGKEIWREFIDSFKDKVEDYAYGTLLRKDCKSDYSEENTILSVRVQWLAIEVARNRENYNKAVHLSHSEKEESS